MVDIQDRPSIAALHDAAFSELEQCMYSTLETYANVHRGAGFKSLATTAIFEHARKIVVDHAARERDRFEVVFCHPGASHEIERFLSHSEARFLSSAELGLPLGVGAIVADRKELSALKPLLVGGGSVDLVSPRSVVWSKAPELFEAGTPAVVNVVAFARALLVAERLGKRVFLDGKAVSGSAEDILRLGDFGDSTGIELLERLRDSFIGRHFRVPAGEGHSAHVNFDNAASTSTPLPVWCAARAALRLTSEAQRDLAVVVKRDLAAFLGARREDFEIIFTANTTGAINLAAHILARNQLRSEDAIVLTTWAEHNSNELPWRMIPGVSLRKIPLAADGLVDMEELARLMRRYAKKVVLVAVSGASNVTGEFIDVERICAVAHEHGALTLVDGAQLFAHRSLDLQKLGVDFFAFSGHKAYAPFGAGALVARRSCLPGGPSILDAMMRAGQENAVGIAALGKAVRLLDRIGMETIQSEELRLSRRILHGLSDMPRLKVYGVSDSSSPLSAWKGGVIAFHVGGIPHNLASRMLAESGGIGTRSGCFCAHVFLQRLLGIQPLRVWLAALFLRLFRVHTKFFLPGLVRVSISAENDQADVERLFESLKGISDYRPSLSERILSRFHCGTSSVPRTAATRHIDIEIGERIRTVYSFRPAAGRREMPFLAERSRA